MIADEPITPAPARLPRGASPEFQRRVQEALDALDPAEVNPDAMSEICAEAVDALLEKVGRSLSHDQCDRLQDIVDEAALPTP